MKDLEFYRKFKKKFAIFSKLFKNLNAFLAKIWRRIWENAFVVGFWHGAPDAGELMENLSRKINGNLEVLYSSKWIFAIF